MSQLLLILISVYQRVVRIVLWSGCRYHPSCSEYAKEAIVKYGAGKGTFLALGRILRCSPLFPGGYDPLK